MLGGDFNEITDNSEKSGGLDRSEADLREFREVIDYCGVMDPGYIGPKFTWCNNHVNHGIIWDRLDRFLINPAMSNKCYSFKVFHLGHIASDHRPLLAEWKEEPPDGARLHRSRPRRFEEVWTKYEDCREIVKQVWSSNVGSTAIIITDKTVECLHRLNQWSRRKYNGSIRGAISRKEKEI